MIWYSEYLQVPNQPADSVVRLAGMYHQPGVGTNAIELVLYVDDFQTVLYTHNPSSLSHEEPAAEDVLARYTAKVNKARRKILGTDFNELGSIRKVI